MLRVTRLTFEKIIFLLYHVITRLGKEGISIEQDRIRIVDVADALCLSTATVSKVIHGKTEKISDETIKRVQQELERAGYIPNMAGILLARNNSRITKSRKSTLAPVTISTLSVFHTQDFSGY